ncbi:MAG: transposase, partial [Planctomycetaceae bacterium]|nr:transposase [Planctomycetaceae bacterium]
TTALPPFVRCGDPTPRFARLRCPTCPFDPLIPFSCKGPGFCPSRAGRRMAAIAAHLTDHVLPDQPLRQWVLSLPWSLRIHLACSPSLTRDVGRAFLRAVFASYKRRARQAGHLGPLETSSPLSHPTKAHPGAINFTQRFGSSLALNIHFHALVLDGVYTTDAPDSIPVFHPALPLTQDEVQRVRQSIHRRVNRVLKTHGLLPSPGSDPSPPT